MEPVEAVARARVGLLGNPGDGYGGQVIAAAIDNFAATVSIQPADHFSIRAPNEAASQTSVLDLVDTVERHGCDDGARLLRAAIGRFARAWPALRALPSDDPRLRFEIGYATTIPRQVGLSGSSAIVMGALRALAGWFGVAFEPTRLAELALAAEVDDLGIAAGPMDRVIQAHEGVLHMELAGAWSEHRYRRLDAGNLPPLFVAWDPVRGAPSGRVHGDLRARFQRGDRDVLDAVAKLRALVDAGLDALAQRDHAAFARAVDANFDVRASICAIAPRDRELVALGRARGAVKFCGSGGSVVGVLDGTDAFADVASAYRAAGFAVERLRIAEPR